MIYFCFLISKISRIGVDPPRIYSWCFVLFVLSSDILIISDRV